ncbi:beta-lactamase class D [Neorhizobium galegae]|uniref:class D beta-lactamase n=1 Tax=Neorhizobium galegae TaxID=399 RepID=UPI001AE9F027|nr:class D beta-lactamase [Neorhizobium galegae]MBP2550386.1 beta-lactamase class D [Neorhizobium galegae]
MRLVLSGFFVSTLLAVAVPAAASDICTIVADAKSGAVFLREGRCAERVTPASTFKLPLSLMAFDAGILKDEHTPSFSYQKGDPAWGGEAWKQPTDAQRWLKYSVVWFSQRLTQRLGAETLHRYAQGFGYGNADFSGDAAKNNGLERAWISSSLKISPDEQVAFLNKFVNRTLPVSREAMEMTVKAMERFDLKDGWVAQGKTGMAYPRLADGSFDRAHPWGWFVGWAQKGGRTVVFAKLVQDERKLGGSASARARDALFEALPALLARN